MSIESTAVRYQIGVKVIPPKIQAIPRPTMTLQQDAAAIRERHRSKHATRGKTGGPREFKLDAARQTILDAIRSGDAETARQAMVIAGVGETLAYRAIDDLERGALIMVVGRAKSGAKIWRAVV
jgi:hypothetical protein